MIFNNRLVLIAMAFLCVSIVSAGCSGGSSVVKDAHASTDLDLATTDVISDLIVVVREASDPAGVVAVMCDTAHELAVGGGCDCDLVNGGMVFGSRGTLVGWVCGCSAPVEVNASVHCLTGLTTTVLTDATLLTSKLNPSVQTREEAERSLLQTEQSFRDMLARKAAH